ncbi:UMP kinase [Candidatus Woesearchaeota archaeon]|nr:UMP kinase [Candidatus Woesearchaeota archaeon]
MKKEVIVLSLGGSVVVPDDIDVKFLKGFRRLIKNYLKKFKFILIVGGGCTCRLYQKAASSVVKLDTEDLDWIGIHSTRLNAHLIKTIFSDVGYKRIIKNPNEKVRFDKVLVAAGWKPGFSTDYDAVILAKHYRAKTVVNMTNIDYLYNKNPKEYKGARKIEKIDWKGFRKIIGNKWIPGMNVPFDPIAAKEAQRLKLKLILIGKNLNNFKNFLDNKKFKGSVVE